MFALPFVSTFPCKSHLAIAANYKSRSALRTRIINYQSEIVLKNIHCNKWTVHRADRLKRPISALSPRLEHVLVTPPGVTHHPIPLAFGGYNIICAQLCYDCWHFSIFLPAVVIIAMTGLHVLQSTYPEPRALPAEHRPNVRFLSLVFPCVRVFRT